MIARLGLMMAIPLAVISNRPAAVRNTTAARHQPTLRSTFRKLPLTQKRAVEKRAALSRACSWARLGDRSIQSRLPGQRTAGSIPAEHLARAHRLPLAHVVPWRVSNDGLSVRKECGTNGELS